MLTERCKLRIPPTWWFNFIHGELSLTLLNLSFVLRALQRTDWFIFYLFFPFVSQAQMLSSWRVAGGYAAQGRAWPTLLSTRIKVILSSKSSPLVSPQLLMSISHLTFLLVDRIPSRMLVNLIILLLTGNDCDEWWADQSVSHHWDISNINLGIGPCRYTHSFNLTASQDILPPSLHPPRCHLGKEKKTQHPREDMSLRSCWSLTRYCIQWQVNVSCL